MHPIKQLLSDGKSGIYAACTSNDIALGAVMKRARETGTICLIEATSNAVNQYGGYSGMSPADFVQYIEDLAFDNKLDPQQVILGADHLGPVPWRDENADFAMEEALTLVRQMVEAGFTKLHIDTTTSLLDDKDELPIEVIATRAAKLVQAARDANTQNRELVFVLGGRVSAPHNPGDPLVASVTDFIFNYDTFKTVFYKHGLEREFENTIAAVTAVGIKYSDFSVTHYNSRQTEELSNLVKNFYPHVVLEAHATDYQPRSCLRQMVADGVRILKVGPALTYRLKEALFSLSRIEHALAGINGFEESHFPEVLWRDDVTKPALLQAYYTGEDLARKLKESFADRSRYYLSAVVVESAIHTLLLNLNGVDLPMITFGTRISTACSTNRFPEILEKKPMILLLPAWKV